MTQAIRIIVVEDDASLRDGMDEYLRLKGFDVCAVGSGVEFFHALAVARFAVAIVDLGLPDMTGQQLVKYLRRCTDTAVIVLTATNTLDTRVRSYQAGADLFMNKPVNALELEAAINSLAARRPLVPEPLAPAAAQQAAAGWWIEPAVWTLHCPNAQAIKFTPKEFAFIALLTASTGNTVRRERLCDSLYERHDATAEAALATLVKRVRSRIEQAGNTAQPIQTDHRVGYRFVGQIVL